MAALPLRTVELYGRKSSHHGHATNKPTYDLRTLRVFPTSGIDVVQRNRITAGTSAPIRPWMRTTVYKLPPSTNGIILQQLQDVRLALAILRSYGTDGLPYESFRETGHYHEPCELNAGADANFNTSVLDSEDGWAEKSDGLPPVLVCRPGALKPAILRFLARWTAKWMHRGRTLREVFHEPTTPHCGARRDAIRMAKQEST